MRPRPSYEVKRRPKPWQKGGPGKVSALLTKKRSARFVSRRQQHPSFLYSFVRLQKRHREPLNQFLYECRQRPSVWLLVLGLQELSEPLSRRCMKSECGWLAAGCSIGFFGANDDALSHSAINHTRCSLTCSPFINSRHRRYPILLSLLPPNPGP